MLNKLISLFERADPGRIITVTAAALLAAAVILTSGFVGRTPNNRYSIEKGKVLSCDNSKLEPDPLFGNVMLGIETMEVRILTGKYLGQELSVKNTFSRFYSFDAKPGMTMLFRVIEDDAGGLSEVYLHNYDRSGMIYAMVVLFFAVLIFIGGKKGLYAIISLLFTLIVVVFFLIPMILRANNPILAAILTSGAATVVTIMLVSGSNKKSIAAIAGIVLGITAAGFLSVLFGALGHVSGLQGSYAEELTQYAGDSGLKLQQLLFAGIIISALGAVMDVGMSISSAVFEVHAANPGLSAWRLYRSGMNVGRDVMGTMSNTLILAFAGGSLNTLLLFVLYNISYMQVISLPMLCIELIQGIAGSIGVVLTVPITAAAAAFLCVAGERGKIVEQG